MTTDRQIVEQALLASIFFSVVVNGSDGEDDAKRIAELLREAAHEPMRSMPAKAAAKLMRRVDRAGHRAMDEFDGASVGKTALVAFELTRRILDCDYLILAEGSPFDVALQGVLAYLEPLAAREPALHASAAKQAGRALARLQEQGYFPGVPRS